MTPLESNAVPMIGLMPITVQLVGVLKKKHLRPCKFSRIEENIDYVPTVLEVQGQALTLLYLKAKT